MRRTWSPLVAAAALSALAAAACAHMEAPPGGPVDEAAPTLLATRPDTLARAEGFAGPVVFVFSEGLSEQGVEEAVTVSPNTGGASVRKVGDEIRVDLRRGWERGRIYHVRVASGIQDRFNNKTTEEYRLVFSTGPEIPDTRLSGVALDRVTARPAVGARVEAVLAPDSLVYVAESDSAGRFSLERIPAGDYVVRAFNDQNKSRRLEEFEARDTTAVRVEAGRPAETRQLSMVEPDTSAPKPGTATYASGVIEVKFDDHLDPAQTLSPSQVTVTGPAGAVAVSEVRVGQIVQRDTTGGTGATALAEAAVRARQQRDTARGGQPARDTAAPVGPVPSQTLSIRPAAELAPETTYRITITGVRNLVGLVGGGESEVKTPRPAPPPARPDSAAAGDTARVVPAPGVPRPPAPQTPAPQPPAPAPQSPPAPAPPPPPPAARPQTPGAMQGAGR